MEVIEHHGLDELRRLAKRQRDGRMRIRLQAVVLAHQGHTAAQVAKILGYSHRAVQQWVRRYNAQGVEGLSDRARSGRPTKLSSKQETKLRKWLDSPPNQRDGVRAWRGKDIQKYLEDEFDVSYSLDGVYKLLHRLGYAQLTPRIAKNVKPPLHRPKRGRPSASNVA